MPRAFVLVNTDIGSELDVLREIKKLEGVEEAIAVYGVYDIVVRVVSDSMEGLKQTITWDIRKLANVRATLTMIVNENKTTTDKHAAISELAIPA